MNATKGATVVILLCVGTVYPLPAPATAGSVDSTGGLRFSGILPGAAPGATVTGAVGAYTWNKRTGQVGNGTLEYDAAGATSELTPVIVKFATSTYPGGVSGWGDNTRTKLPNTSEVARSNLDGMIGHGRWSAGAKSSVLTSSAFVPGTIFGYAAGYASDPYLVSKGSYSVAPALDGSLLLQTNPEDPTSEAGIIFSAQSIGLGGSNANLWTLAITEIGASSPVVSFTSAPILGLDDATVTATLSSALDTSDPGTVKFMPNYQTSGFTLFSTTLSAGTDFYFGDAFEADASNNVSGATPEPASLTLLGIGAAVLGGYGWRRRKRAKTELPEGTPET